MFKDPEEPIATCESGSCSECTVQNRIHCHFKLKDLIHFLLLAIPPFLLGGAGIYYVSGWLLVPWLIFVFSFFGFIEIRVMCSHCPHYAEDGAYLRCWANYGSPKLWTYRPGPMTIMEKIVFLTGFAIIWGYPLIFLIIYLQMFFIIVYSITTCGFFITLKTCMCSQCMNFACPLNSVKEGYRIEFLRRNPTLQKVWREPQNE